MAGPLKYPKASLLGQIHQGGHGRPLPDAETKNAALWAAFLAQNCEFN